jgi:8-oxo-dGTP pyrophosphatase MutT (NUDIX family)
MTFLTITAVAIAVFDARGRLLLGRDSEMDRWTLPGGGIDPNELPADAAVRECYEETGLLVRLDGLIGIFGGPEFLTHYPNGDVTYYTTAAFRGAIVGGAHQPVDGELAELRYCNRSECGLPHMSPPIRIISRRHSHPPTNPILRRQPGHLRRSADPARVILAAGRVAALESDCVC